MKLFFKNKNLILVENNNDVSFYKKINEISLIEKTKNSLLNKPKISKARVFLTGLGYKCNIIKNFLNFKLNLSHSLEILLPEYITKVSQRKTVITIESTDKILLNNFCENLYRLRPIDSYQQKGLNLPRKTLIVKEVNKKNKKN